MSDLVPRTNNFLYFKEIADATAADGSTVVVEPGTSFEYDYGVRENMRLESIGLFEHENGRADVRVRVIDREKIEGEVRWSSIFQVEAVQVKMNLPKGTILRVRVRNISAERLLARIALRGTWLVG